MTLTIRGKTWALSFCELPEDKRGLCDAPSTPGKRILISEDLEGEELLEVLVHEVLHAAFWDMSEEAVCETASDMARALTRLGLRFVEE